MIKNSIAEYTNKYSDLENKYAELEHECESLRKEVNSWTESFIRLNNTMRDSHVFVPNEPTTDMLRRGGVAWAEAEPDALINVDCAYACYMAMLDEYVGDKTRPKNCRHVWELEGKPYPTNDCYACNNFLFSGCPYDE